MTKPVIHGLKRALYGAAGFMGVTNMLSSDYLMDELIKDIESETAAALDDKQPIDTSKETYTRAEVDALIMEKMKELKGEMNNGSNEGSEEGSNEGSGEEGGNDNE